MSPRGPKAARARAPELFGPLLSKLRVQKGVTQHALVHASHVTRVAQVESRDAPPPDRDGVLRLARALELGPRERLALLGAAAYDRGKLDLDGLTAEQVQHLADRAELLRGGGS